MNHKLLIILFLGILLFASCESKECSKIDNYTFEIPFTLTPALDTFQIGDTIIFHSKFEKKLTDLDSDETYILEDFKFRPTTELNQIDMNPAIDGVNSFELLIEDTTDYKIESFSTGQLILGEYNFDGQYYSLTFKLIPTKVGLFHLEQISWLSRLQSQSQSFEGKCSGKDIENISNLNDGADNNIDFLLDSPDPRFNTWILEKPFERFHKFGGYCFYVVKTICNLL